MSAHLQLQGAAARRRHHRTFVAAMSWVAGIGALVVYLGGVRLLFHQASLWVLTCGQIIRRALGCP